MSRGKGLELRDYQKRAVDWVLRCAVEKPNARLLVVLPMGGGKTAIAAVLMNILVAKQGRTTGMFIAHREELLDNARASMLAVGIPDKMMVGPEETLGQARIMLTSADAVRSANDGVLPPVDLVITDEAHRDASDYRRKLRSTYNDVLRVGFTATPERLDGRSLREDFDDMLVAAQPSELIAQGHLIAPRVLTVPHDRMPDLRGVRVTDGDFDGKELERRMSRFAVLGDIVDHWKRKAEDRVSLAFACSTAHSKAIVERFIAAGVRAVHLDGNVASSKRADTLDALREGHIDVVSSCELLAEGIDIPAIKCVIMARPTASLVVCNQQAGRCMRVLPNSNITALILDHAGNIIRHGYPHADREWSLENVRAKRYKQTPTSPSLLSCPKCHEVVPSQGTCPTCKANLAPDSTTKRPSLGIPTELPGELVDIATATPMATRVAEYQRLVAFAETKGFGEEWVGKVYRAKYGDSNHT